MKMRCKDCIHFDVCSAMAEGLWREFNYSKFAEDMKTEHKSIPCKYYKNQDNIKLKR